MKSVKIRLAISVIVVMAVLAALLLPLLHIDMQYRYGFTQRVELCGSVTPERIDVYNVFGDHPTADVHQLPNSHVQFVCETHLTISAATQSFTPDELKASPVNNQ